MPASGALDSLKLGDRRGFVQFGGARPNNKPYFYGGDTNYFTVTGVSAPQSGGVTSITVASPYQAGKFISAGVTIAPADLPSYSLTFREKTKSIPRHWLAQECLLTTYVMGGRCASMQDMDYGWEGFIEVFSNGRVTDFSPGDRTSFDADTPVETALGLTAESIYAIGNISLGAKATGAGAAIVDITYSNKRVCGECGPANNGTQWIYAIETGNGAAKPALWYSTDGGNTWGSLSIAVAAAAEAPTAVRIMGNYIVVLSPTANTATSGGYYWVGFNPATGVPSGVFTKVTTGFLNNAEPRDMVVLSPKKAFICSDNSTIYYLTDVPAGVVSRGSPLPGSDLLRIASDGGDTIVAVGLAGAIVKSLNGGDSFSVATTTPGGSPALTGVAVLDQFRYWITSATGAWWTDTGAETAWNVASLPLTLAGATDIVFATNEVGYIAYASGGIAKLLATINGGVSWIRADFANPRIQGMPTATITAFTRLAVPRTELNNINANYLLAAPATGAGLTYVGAPNLY